MYKCAEEVLSFVLFSSVHFIVLIIFATAAEEDLIDAYQPPLLISCILLQQLYTRDFQLHIKGGVVVQTDDVDPSKIHVGYVNDDVVHWLDFSESSRLPIYVISLHEPFMYHVYKVYALTSYII